jgi:hypothetical protein
MKKADPADKFLLEHDTDEPEAISEEFLLIIEAIHSPAAVVDSAAGDEAVDDNGDKDIDGRIAADEAVNDGGDKDNDRRTTAMAR